MKPTDSICGIKETFPQKMHKKKKKKIAETLNQKVFKSDGTDDCTEPCISIDINKIALFSAYLECSKVHSYEVGREFLSSYL